MNRTVVALRNKNGKFKIPKFTDCLLDFFGNGTNSVTVSCSVENDMLVLTECVEGSELRHSPQCPIKLYANFSDSSEGYHQDETSSNIGVATSVAVESSDSHILLTKRAAHMRASPNVWVLPGGHLEYGETVLEAGIRETKEETSLDVTAEKSSILGFWENIYPLFLGLGKPKYHVLVVYLHVCLDETYEELTKKIIPDPTEVNSYCWLNAKNLSKLFNADGSDETVGTQYIFENDTIVERPLNYSTMFNKWALVQGEPHSGVNFALRKWMEKISLRMQKSKF